MLNFFPSSKWGRKNSLLKNLFRKNNLAFLKSGISLHLIKSHFPKNVKSESFNFLMNLFIYFSGIDLWLFFMLSIAPVLFPYLIPHIGANTTFINISCSCSISQSCLTLCDPVDCSKPGFPVLHHLPRACSSSSIELVMPSNHLILCCLHLLLPSIFPSIRAFSNVSALHIRWQKYWSFSFSPSNEYSELISFTIDWFDLFAVQRTLKSLQHHSSKASVLWRSAFFTVQLSHPYMSSH